MRIVVAGGTGFLGRALGERLRQDGHDVRVLSRRAASPGDIAWSPDGSTGAWAKALDDADAVVNLAGESIAGGRWTAARKARIRDSRIRATRSLVTAIQQAARPPAVLLSGSAVGYYGPRGDEPLTEQAPAGDDFLAGVCRDWEAEALRAASTTRVVLLRTGLVLDKDGGALPQMALPFKLFGGGPVGSGRQFYSWIHRGDWVGLVRWALGAGRVSGPLNLTAPNPLPNREFAKTLGRVLRRPSFMPAPGVVLRVALGEMADALLLAGQRVLPAEAQAQGYRFEYPTLEPALRAIYARR
ncbi:MAG: TIGR01777 family oxidoreductase [Vicinamibacterales bacterium]